MLYKVINIQEADYGCEELPDGEEVTSLVAAGFQGRNPTKNCWLKGLTLENMLILTSITG